MLYIRKSKPSREVAVDISRVRREQRSLIDRGTPEAALEVFDCLNKPLLRKSLIAEQHGLCAYCMRRIRDNADMTIEHWRPIDSNSWGAMDYENMLGVCDGGRKAGRTESEGSRPVLCCDASKGNREITISPCNPDHMQKIRYVEDGRI